jgi:hypothetical protein
MAASTVVARTTVMTRTVAVIYMTVVMTRMEHEQEHL